MLIFAKLSKTDKMIIFIKMNFFLQEVTNMQKKKVQYFWGWIQTIHEVSSNLSKLVGKNLSSFLTKFYIFDFENSLDWIKRKWTDQ